MQMIPIAEILEEAMNFYIIHFVAPGETSHFDCEFMIQYELFDEDEPMQFIELTDEELDSVMSD